jgi:lipid-binding SYLF domain-containing protein
MTVRTIATILVLLLISAMPCAAEETVDEADKRQMKRKSIDTMASQTLERLFQENPEAKELYDRASGYAVFDNLRVTFLVTGGGGVGVAVDRATGERTYMKMGTGGLALGIGGQSYQVVFFFQTDDVLDGFVNKGWHADASATAAAGTAGANAPTTFRNGIAIYQLTNKGLMAQADISGTKYWKSKKLNDTPG